MKNLIFMFLALGSFAGSAANAQTIGDACTTNQIGRYFLDHEGICRTEVLTCVNGKLELLEQMMPPAPGKCEEFDDASIYHKDDGKE